MSNEQPRRVSDHAPVSDPLQETASDARELEDDEIEDEELEEEEGEDEVVWENALEDEDDDEEEDDDDAPPPVMGGVDSEEKVRLMASAADAVRAADIHVLDLRGLTIIADFFLVCTGKSSLQIRAIADRIEERLRDSGLRKLRVEGYQEATWILLDYGDVVAHVMAEEQREFYNLEEFWSSAPLLELDLTPEPSASVAPTRFDSLNDPAAIS